MALVDYNPSRDRVTGVNSMIEKSEVVILHDSQEPKYNIPDFSW